MWAIMGEWTDIGYHTKFVETISKDDIHNRPISEENVGDSDPDIGKRNFA